MLCPGACQRIPTNTLPTTRIFLVAAANGGPHVAGRNSDSVSACTRPEIGGLVLIDTASLRPVIADRGGCGVAERAMNDVSPVMHLDRFATVSTFQGARHHPETIRAIAADSVAMANAARAIVSMAAFVGSRIMIDFQGVVPNDLPAVVETVRAISAVGARLGTGRPLAIVLPPGDTVSYPTEVLARVADLLVLRLHGEHRPGTAPGPLTTPEFIAREIGLRARQVGTNRLVAELALFGYRWNRDGTATMVTYAESQALVLAEAGVFRRHPPSQFLTATSRDGWTIWVPDAVTVDAMIAAVRRRGVSQVVLAGAWGAPRGNR